MSEKFPAMLARMNYIDRWGLMRNSRPESLSEHSLFTAYVAHYLSVLAVRRFGADVDPMRVACAAMYHDASEILTGDMPTPVKYGSDALRDEYKRVEAAAERRLLGLLPEDLRDDYIPFLSGEGLSERERRIVKAADKISALVKCREEMSAGGREFFSAMESTIKSLRIDPLPETELFLSQCLPAFNLTLDELLAEEEQ